MSTILALVPPGSSLLVEIGIFGTIAAVFFLIRVILVLVERAKEKKAKKDEQE